MDKTSEQAGGRKAVRRRLRQIAQIKELLRQADDAWSAASSATGTASMAEAFDFFSKSKAVSFYSAMQSAQAASQIEHAQAAMRRLEPADLITRDAASQWAFNHPDLKGWIKENL